MQLREVFDIVRNHLLTQNATSFSVDRQCAYRGAGGLKCAIGCLIPDHDYHPNMEGPGIRSNSLVWRALEKRGIKWEDTTMVGLLYDLQNVHDAWTPSAWVDLLEQVEEKYFPLPADAAIG